MSRTEASERRLRERSTANSPAVMIVGGDESPCVVLDFSGSGARLCIASARVPPRFNLRFQGHTYGCEVAWQEDMEIGVSFCDLQSDRPEPGSPAPAPPRKVDVRGLRSQLFGKGR